MSLKTLSTFYVYVFDCPKSVNHGGGGTRRHWAVAHREKQRWQRMFESLFMAEGIPRKMTGCTVDITVRWRHRNRRDVENWRHPIVKPLADALTNGGWLPDDTAEFFEVRSFKFEYPERWGGPEGSKVELGVHIEAVYA